MNAKCTGLLMKMQPSFMYASGSFGLMQLLALTVTWHSSRAFGPPSHLGGAGGTGGGGGFASVTDSTAVATFEMAENVPPAKSPDMS